MSTASEEKLVPSEKELVPLVEAKQVLEADSAVHYKKGGTAGSASATGKDPTPIPPAKVKLTAPSGFPPNYKLSIKYQEGGQTVYGYCRVPSGGVSAGDHFEAEILQPRVITGRWAVGVFDCGSLTHDPFFTASCCCAAMAWGYLYDSAFHKPRRSCTLLMFVLLVLHYGCRSMLQDTQTVVDDDHLQEGDVASLLSNMTVIAIFGALTFIRWKIRQKYQIQGNCCEDCLCVSFCACCSAIQACQHLNLAHDGPRMETTVIAERTLTPLVNIV